MGRIGDLVSAIKARKGKKALGKALSVSVLNQVVSSGTNFAFGIYLVRMLPPAEFGLYGIGFAISMFYAGFGNVLFLTQMVVHTPDKAPEDRLPYAGRMLLLVALFCVATILSISLMLQVSGLIWESVPHYFQFANAVMAASVSYLLKDFFVRHAYNVHKESLALSIHGSIACTMAVLLWLQHLFEKPLNVEIALWVYSASQVSGAILGYLFAKLPVAAHQWSDLFGDLREALHGGKWASITNLVYFARTQAHTIVVAALLGPMGVAKLNAARLLVTPAFMLMPALSQVAMPRLAAAREHGEHRLRKRGRLITTTMLVVALLYCAILLSGYDLIVKKVLGEYYQDLLLVTALWCLWTCLTAVRYGAEIVWQVLRRFKKLSGINTLGALLSLVATYVLTSIYGLHGALIGLALGEVVMIIFLYSTLLYETSSFN